MIPDSFRFGLPTAAEVGGSLGDLHDNSAIVNKPITGVTDVGPGATTRVILQSGRKLTLQISHSQTNENKPFRTVRTLIRLDEEKVDSETGTVVKQSAYVVVTSPQGANYTDAQVLENTYALLLFAIGGGTSDGGELGNNPTWLGRILAGEP